MNYNGIKDIIQKYINKKMKKMNLKLILKQNYIKVKNQKNQIQIFG